MQYIRQSKLTKSDDHDNSGQSKVLVNEQTKDRLKNLAYVGQALGAIHSEVAYSTDFFIAKESLNRFEEAILSLDLEPDVEKGMKSLISYLHSKIDRRMKNADAERSKPIT